MHPGHDHGSQTVEINRRAIGPTFAYIVWVALKRTLLAALSILLVSAACNASEEETEQSEDKEDWFGFSDEPFADMYNSTSSVDVLALRGRIIEEDPDDNYDLTTTPLGQVTQDEMKNEDVEIALFAGDRTFLLGSVTTDDEGYLDTQFDISGLNLEPGRYTLEVRIDSKRIGTSLATLLSKTRTTPVVRSDVDLTYLQTDFQSSTAMLSLLNEEASEKTAMPGMVPVYRGIRGDDEVPVTFLSGSPKFFKRSIESKMVLDMVDQDGVVLKPFKDITASHLLDLSWTSIIPDLKEQVGYKMYWLLKLRQLLPASTPEILMGDDSEADFVVYNIYYRFMAGELDVASLQDELKAVHVTELWLGDIDQLARSVDRSGDAAPVAIYINDTDATGDAFDIRDWVIPGITRYHRGAWPLALDMQEEGWLGSDEVEQAHAALLATGMSEQELRDHAESADFLD